MLDADRLTLMVECSRPSRGVSGGTARRTALSLRLCQAVAMSQQAPLAPVPTVAPAAPEARRPRSRIVARCALAAAVALVLVLLAGLGWASRHPTAFPPAGNGVGDNAARVGVTTYVGITDPYAEPSGSVEIDSASADIVAGGAAVTTNVLVCTLGTTGGVGLVRGSQIDNVCTAVEPATDANLSLGPPLRQQLVLAMTPIRASESVDISGVDVTYTDGWHHGTQQIGPHITLTILAP